MRPIFDLALLAPGLSPVKPGPPRAAPRWIGAMTSEKSRRFQLGALWGVRRAPGESVQPGGLE